MWICFLLFGVAVSMPGNEYKALIFEDISREEELSLNYDNLLKQIPSDFLHNDVDESKYSYISNLLNKDNENYKSFVAYVKKDVTSKGQTFFIYDDDMRNATIALFRILLETRHNDGAKYDKLMNWAKENVHSDMLDYAGRLVSLFSAEKMKENFKPPFITKPNYFVNGETIMKAFYVKRNLGKISDEVMKIYQIFKINENHIFINTNYSQWNDPTNACDMQIKYFTEDVALNSYYYGMHLLHPFWMTNNELSELNPRHAEHYYFTHQQLNARYLLEKEHLDPKSKFLDNFCEVDFNPYLYYENGLSFPTRSSIFGNDLRKEVAHLHRINKAIEECIKSGMVVMENGTYIKMNEDNYIDMLAKLIRANLDSIKTTKLIRSIFGYGNNGYPVNTFNPSPSVLHHPQTTLRDFVYWNLIRMALDYFTVFTNKTEPFDISRHETNKFVIADANFSRISTTFEYFYLNLYKSLEGDKSVYDSKNLPTIYARQRRLNYKPFTMNFTVESRALGYVTLRIFLGPQCDVKNCSQLHLNFFLLDCYRFILKEGKNTVVWSPDISLRLSNLNTTFSINANDEQDYDIFKFPKNLIIPKGLIDGLNLTLFVMILEDNGESYLSSDSRLYNKVTREIDNRPLGFPFHRKANMFRNNAPNYRFYNISVFHTKTSLDETGYFSSNLY